MGTRLELQILLETFIANVYFQPPPSFKMTYPCIVYSLNGTNTLVADNKIYNVTKRYMITLIDSSPDSLVWDKILALPKSSFDKRYISDNLNHDVFNVYY